MKLIFFGTPEFAVPSLSELFKSEHEIISVVTNPDKKSGRVFYYNTKTKKTQWTKPADDSDNSVKEDKKSKTSKTQRKNKEQKDSKNY